MAGGLSKIKGFFSRGHQRSLKAKKNIALSFGLKGVNMAISFIQVPLLIGFIGEAKYGIWLTIGSVINWFSFLDIGLDHGLRNHLAKALAKGDRAHGKTLVSSTYFAIGIEATLIFIVFAFANHFLNWADILRAPQSLSSDLNSVMLVVFGLFCVRFVLKLIGTVLTADQRPSLNNSILTTGNVLSLAGILVFIGMSSDTSLMSIGILVTAPVVIVYIIANFYFFRTDYSDLRPSFAKIDKTQIKSLLSLGLKFFILQAGQIIIYTTDNMIITRILGPEAVTTYFIPFKYFSIITMAFSIIMVPMWSAFTQAQAQNDDAWIRKTIKKLIMVWVAFGGLALVMLAVSPWVYKLWVGESISSQVPLQLSILMALFVCVSTFSTIFLNYLNGMGKVTVQLIVILFSAGINIPLSVYFGKTLGLGNSGVILASTVCMLFFAIITPIQVRMLLKGTAKGIWNK